jgi:lipopolysaccharide transport system permease protein
MSYVNYETRQLPFIARYILDVAKFRHLCWNLVGSDLRSRFRRSRLGILWAVIYPLCFSLLIALVWGSVFKAASYWEFTLYVFSGMIVWEFFSQTIFVSMDSLLGAQGYLKQARIPFIIFQLRVPLTCAVIFLAGLLGFVALAAILQRLPPLGYHYLQALAFVPMMVTFVAPFALLFSVIATQFRDVRHITGIAIQAVFFVSPVMLSRDVLDQQHLHWLQYANPVVTPLKLFRDIFINGQIWTSHDLTVFGAWTCGLWVLAIAVSAQFGRKLVFAL